MTRLPEPAKGTPDTKALFLDYLDYYRATIESKLAGLSEPELRRSRLPSGWTPLQLLKHLVFMERRWLRWGFSAEPMAEPFGEDDAQGSWYVGSGESAVELIAALHEGGRRTRQIVEAAELSAPSAVGGRFPSPEEAPPLVWVLFHVLQEYARHAGHLDIVRELSDGATGE
jgi:hypothetical protein